MVPVPVVNCSVTHGTAGNSTVRGGGSTIGTVTPPQSPKASPQTATPLRVVRKESKDNIVTSPPARQRLHSREIPRCYSGLYGDGSEDLRPLELARNRGPWLHHIGVVLVSYVVAVALCQAFFAATWEDSEYLTSWTRTNGLHFATTLSYLHWSKGSIYDEQGEMNAMTVWEQLEANQGTEFVMRFLKIVPTFVCYCACHFADFKLTICLINIALWTFSMAAKTSFMNDKRLFGINSTVGIDDFGSILSPSSSYASLSYENKKQK